MGDIAPYGPFVISVEFSLTDGEQVAKATFACSPGAVPTTEQLAAAAESVKHQVQAQIGEHFRWQTRHEFVQDMLADRAPGVRLAVSGPNKFEAEWAK